MQQNEPDVSPDSSPYHGLYYCCLLRSVLCCRNNTSDYYVNGKRMNVKEVTTLLKGKGIDLDNNRFLILQVCGDSIRARIRSHGGTRTVLDNSRA
jgi:hypothetical protein